MSKRAPKSGISLTAADVAIVKGMLARGDRQHDIASWFGVNGGRIAEIATGFRFDHVEATTEGDLPPPGPYPAVRVTHATLEALASAKVTLEDAERRLQGSLK